MRPPPPSLLCSLDNRSFDGTGVGTELGQNGRTVAAIADDSEQHMVCVQVLVAPLMSRFQRSRERTAGRRGEWTATRAGRL